MSNIWAIDTCDSCTTLTLTKHYTHEDQPFVWCDDCADPSATERPL